MAVCSHRLGARFSCWRIEAVKIERDLRFCVLVGRSGVILRILVSLLHVFPHRSRAGK